MAYNEVQNLAQVVEEVYAVLLSIGHSHEIIIVDDGSTDGTGELADSLQAEIPTARVLHHQQNYGLGGVYRTGFAEAQARFVTFTAADGQFPATIIQQFYPLMSDTDMVLGYLPKRKRSLLAESLSFAERGLYRIILGPMPKFQGIVMFRRDLLDRFDLQSTGRGWAVLMELIIRASRGGYRLVSVPTEMRPRISGRSKVNNLPAIWANLKQVVALRHYL